MVEHPSKTELERYTDQALTASELLRVDAHLSDCSECSLYMKQRFTIDRTGPALAEALAGNGVDDHLTYDQIEGYVDGSLEIVEREMAEVHAAVCTLCSAQLDDLRKINAGLIGQSVTHLPASPGFWEAIRNSVLLKWSAPVLAALVLVLGWWNWPGTGNVPRDEVTVNTGIPDQIIQSQPDTIPEVAANSGTNTVASAGEPVAWIADAGGRIAIDAAGNLTGINAGRFAATLKSVLAGGDIQVSPDARSIRSSVGVLMGGGDAGVPFKLNGPVGKIVVSDRPQLSWSSVDGANGYIVNLYDDDLSMVATSPVLKQPKWTPDTALKRGTFYKWQVTARKDGQEIKSPVRPAPDARFKVVDAASASDIEAAKRQAGNSHLLLGIVYARAGLVSEAEQEFQALLRQNPNSPIAKRSLQRLRSAR